MTNEEARLFLLEMFTSLFDPREEPQVDRFMTEDYTQLVDDKLLDRAGFLQHLQTVREAITAVEFQFEELVADENMIAERHLIMATKTDLTTMSAEVIALHHLRDGRVSRIVELTRLVSGSEADKDLGSRT